MNMKISLRTHNGGEKTVDFRFAIDGVYVLDYDIDGNPVHFNDLTQENKKRIIRHCMNQQEKVSNE